LQGENLLFLVTYASSLHFVLGEDESDSPKQLRIDVHPKQVPVNRLPLSGFCPQPEIIFVRLNQRVWLVERVTMVTAPAVIGRTLRDVGTNGVELNVPVTGEEIPVTLYS
jgi:hypothetical protein